MDGPCRGGGERKVRTHLVGRYFELRNRRYGRDVYGVLGTNMCSTIPLHCLAFQEERKGHQPLRRVPISLAVENPGHR